MANEDIDLTQDVETLSTVSANLSELLTNSVNMVDKYYEIFFDQTPHYVELEQYDSDGNIFKTLVPNRALDRSVALEGDTDPEDEIESSLGTLYINRTTREIFVKKTPDGNKGWLNLTPQQVEAYVDRFDVNSETQTVLLSSKVNSKEYIDIYLNGKHLDQDDFELGYDFQTVSFNIAFPDTSKLEVHYLNGLYGLKGSTAISVKIGKTTTVDSNTPANVTNVGTDEELVLDFTLPKGETGDSGVHVGTEMPTDKAKVVWIDPSAEKLTDDELSVSRIFDSGVNTNKTAYNKAYNIKHSSVDCTKFSTTGSVHITDEGYATSISKGSYIKLPLFVKQFKGQNWSISGRDYINPSAGSYHFMYAFGFKNQMQPVLFFRSSNRCFCFRLSPKNNQAYSIYDKADMYNQYGQGWYNWKVERKNGSYNLYMSFQDDPLKLIFTKQDNDLQEDGEENIYLHGYGKDYFSCMTANIAKYTIRINDEVVWTANKTEVDKVIEDQYKLIGNPTITDKGILTRVADCQHFPYGELTADETCYCSYTIEGEFIHLGFSQVLWQFANPLSMEAVPTTSDIHAGDYKMMSTYLDATNNKCIFYITTGDVSAHSEPHGIEFPIVKNTEYFYKYEYNNSTRIYTFTLSTNKYFEKDVQVKTYTPTTASHTAFVGCVHPEYKIILGSTNTKGNQITIYNDLNCFKITVDGKVKFKPLFRIPVTMSRFGAKFADIYYRKQVQEAYNIYNKGDYYVLDEDKQTVELPLSDIYSLIGNMNVNYGKGLKYNSVTRTLENTAEGFEIGDIGESVHVDESAGTRRKLNGQQLVISTSYQQFFDYVKSLDPSLKCTEAEWQAIAKADANGDCHKFVIDSKATTTNTKYYAFIPENFVIRTPEGGDETPTEPTDPEEPSEEKRYCKECGAELKKDQLVCDNCFTVNELPRDDEDTDTQSLIATFANTTIKVSISDELTESDIIYTTSLNALDKDCLYKKINNIVYPYDNGVTVADLLDENNYYRYEIKDFSQDVTSETVNYVRLPHLTSPRAGYTYYIQVANNSKDTVELVRDYKTISPYCFGMYQYSDVDVNSAGWLLSAGQWNSGDLYKTFYNWILDNANKKVARFSKLNNAGYSVSGNDFVINETNHTFRLPLVASMNDYTNKRFLVAKKEPNESDTTWYNYYSDGYIEQGGYMATAGSTNGDEQIKTITFVIPYNTSAAYTVTYSSGVGASGWQYANGACIGAKEKTYFTLRHAVGTGNIYLAWRANGYGAIPQMSTYNLSKLYYYVGDTVHTLSEIDLGYVLNELAKLKAKVGV